MDKKIIKACVRYKEKLYTGFDHGECLTKLQEDCKEINYEEIEQGFLDNDMIFVDRKEAMVIARDAGQLSYVPNKQTLISEDLHLSWLKDQSLEITKLKKEIEQAKERFIDHKKWDGRTIREQGDRLEELELRLKNCIEPQFKVGDKAYALLSGVFDTYVKPVSIVGIMLGYKVWDGEDTINLNYPRIFATEEEAKTKVKELKHGVKS